MVKNSRMFDLDGEIGRLHEIDDEITELYQALIDVWPIIAALYLKSPKGYKSDLSKVRKNTKRLLKRYGYFS